MIAIVGTGAVGGVCAAHLAAAGRAPLCCVRRPFRALALEGPDAPPAFRPRVLHDPEAVASLRVEWVLLATKAHQTPGAAGWLRAFAPGGARLAVLQNGVEHVARVAPWWPEARVLPVVVDCPATATAPGRIVQRRPARLTAPDTASGRAFAALFAGTPVAVALTADWSSAAWRKLCVNATGGALAALAGVPLAEVRHPRLAELAASLARECARVARAEGADVDDAHADAVAERVLRSGGQPSTLQDRLAGRPLEWEARNGAVVRAGARHGIPVPVNARACALLEGIHRDRVDRLPALAEALGPPRA